MRQLIHHYEVDLVDGRAKTVESRRFQPDELDAATAFSREHATSHPGSSPTTVFAAAGGGEGAESHGLLEGTDYRTVFSNW